MIDFEVAVGRVGWHRIEAAAYAWAGRMRRREEGCPPLVGAWRRALADVVEDFVAASGVDGLYELAERVVQGVETTTPRVNVLDDAVARWSRLVRALDSHSGAPSSFPLTVLSETDLATIVAIADEREVRRSNTTVVPASEAHELAG